VVSVSDFGLSVTFTAPKTVNVREPFSWDVLVLNRSNKPVQLAFTVITKRKSRVNEGHLPRSFTSSATESKNSDTAEAVIDENFVYARQRNASNEAAQVINLTTDVRIGYV